MSYVHTETNTKMSLTQSDKILLADLKIQDPTILADESGYHIIGLLPSGNNSSSMIYVYSEDLISIKKSNTNFITAGSNFNIWSGCIFSFNGKFHLFYTTVTQDNDYWAVQTINRAETKDFINIDWTNIQLTPQLADNNRGIFQYKPEADSYTVHAWRDPYVFYHNNRFYMLVAAKLSKRKHFNASIALLSSDNLNDWQLENPSIIDDHTGYEELELPSVYCNDAGEIFLVTCTWQKEDYIATGNAGYNPLINNTANEVRRKGMILVFMAKNIDDAVKGKFSFHSTINTPPDFYAGCLIPNRNLIAGHNKKTLSLMLIESPLKGCRYL